MEPVCCSKSSSNCCFWTCIQISQEASKVVWYYLLFKNFPQFAVIYTVKDFGVVNKSEVDVFLQLSCFFYDLTDVGNLISGSSAFSKSSLNIWKFTVHIVLKPVLEDFTSLWDEYNSAVVWTFFGIAFIWGWNKNWRFPVLWLLLHWHTAEISCSNLKFCNSSFAISSFSGKTYSNLCFCSFFNYIVCSFYFWVYIFWICVFYQTYYLQIFSPNVSCRIEV